MERAPRVHLLIALQQNLSVRPKTEYAVSLKDDEFSSAEEDQDPVTGRYRAAVARLQRLLRLSWDPDGTLIGDPDRPDAYEYQARHVASLVWMDETPEFI